MKKLVRSVFAGVALAMPLTLIAASPALAAGQDVGTISGDDGVISPGLGVVPEAQNFSFGGTATVVGTDGVLATYPCGFTGHDIAGSAAAGVGDFSGGCGPIQFTSCNFVRAAVAVVAACVEATTAPSVKVGAGACVFTPTDTNPTTKFGLLCAIDYTSLP